VVGCAQHLKAVAPIVHLDVQRLLQQPQVFVVRTAQPGQALRVVRGQLQRLAYSFAQATPTLRSSTASTRPRSELSSASVIMTSTKWPTSRSWPSKLTQRLESVRPANWPPPRLAARSTSTRCVVPTMVRM